MFANTTNRRNVGGVAELHSFKGSYKVEYFADFEKNADYTDMAARYREYLIKNYELEKEKHNPGINLDVYGILQTQKQFLGIPYKKDIALTTFSQLEKIVSEFGDKISMVNFFGWQKGGAINLKPLKNTSISSCVGGKKSYSKATSKLEENGTILNLATNPLIYKKGEKSYAVKDLYNTPVTTNQYLRSVYTANKKLDSYYYINPIYINKIMDKYLKYYKNNQIKNVAFDGISSDTYSSYSSENKFIREDFPNTVRENLIKYKKDGINVTVYGANAYCFGLVSHILSAPMSSGGSLIFDRDIPFYQIVLHGYIPMSSVPLNQTDESVAFLQAVEAGMEISYSCIYSDSSLLTGTEYEKLYSSTYTLLKDNISKKYKQYNELLEKISNSIIVSHSTFNNVARTDYENGISVIVNYNDNPITVDGITVPAKNFISIGE